MWNDKRKSGIRRLKLTDANALFVAPGFAQVALDAEFERQFGDSYLGGQFIARPKHWSRPEDSKSFCIYLTA